MRGCKTRSKMVSIFVWKKSLCQSLVGPPWQKPSLNVRTEKHKHGRKLYDCVSASSTDSRKKGSQGDGILGCAAVNNFFTFIFPNLQISGEALLAIGFVLRTVKCQNLQPRCHSLLFHDFRQCNTRADRTHHPVIQNEVDGHLSQGSHWTITW